MWFCESIGESAERAVELKRESWTRAADTFPQHKVPAAIRFVRPCLYLPREKRYGIMHDAMRNIVVTGGSRGLGLGIAQQLVAAAIGSSPCAKAQ